MNRKPEFCHAFLAVTEKELAEEIFIELEMKAMEILALWVKVVESNLWIREG